MEHHSRWKNISRPHSVWDSGDCELAEGSGTTLAREQDVLLNEYKPPKAADTVSARSLVSALRFQTTSSFSHPRWPRALLQVASRKWQPRECKRRLDHSQPPRLRRAFLR